MGAATKIQWCDNTVNPVMGCGGCPLWPTAVKLLAALVLYLLEVTKGVEKLKLENIVEVAFKGYGAADLCRYDVNIIYQINDEVARILPSGHAAVNITEEYKSHFKCYAGVLSSMKFDKNGKALKGWPDSFDLPQKFENRMTKIAKLRDLRGTDREDKPWLNGLPRLIFVSDMGDALSAGIDFEYLKQEIIDGTATDAGKLHLYLWLTKRPARMVEFDKWLQNASNDWPDRLVAMTSVIDRATAKGVDQLRKVRAKIRGLSVEPLREPVALDLTGIDWVIVGGESGSGKNSAPFHLEWAYSLLEQCRESGKAFFMKQLGSNAFLNGQPYHCSDSHGGDWHEWPHDLRIREVPAAFYAKPADVPADAMT